MEQQKSSGGAEEKNNYQLAYFFLFIVLWYLLGYKNTEIIIDMPALFPCVLRHKNTRKPFMTYTQKWSHLCKLKCRGTSKL